MSDIKTKPVCFNLKDPHQKMLFDHLDSMSNASGYLKNLIFLDMKGVVIQRSEHTEEAPVEVDLSLIQSFV